MDRDMSLFGGGGVTGDKKAYMKGVFGAECGGNLTPGIRDSLRLSRFFHTIPSCTQVFFKNK